MFESDSNEESDVPMTRVSDALRATGADKFSSDDDELDVEESKLIDLNKLIQMIKLNTPDRNDVTRDLKEDEHNKQMLDRCEHTDQPRQKSPSQKQVENLMLAQSRLEVDAMIVELNKIKEENALMKIEMADIISIKEKLEKDLDNKNVQLSELKEIRKQSEDKNEQLMKLGRHFMEVLSLAENENSSNYEENTECNPQKHYGMSQNSPSNEQKENDEHNCSIFCQFCELFVHDVDEHIKRHEIIDEFGKPGTVTDAYSSLAEVSKPHHGGWKDGHEGQFQSKAEGEGCERNLYSRDRMINDKKISAYNRRLSKLPPRLAKQREVIRVAARDTVGSTSPSDWPEGTVIDAYNTRKESGTDVHLLMKADSEGFKENLFNQDKMLCNKKVSKSAYDRRQSKLPPRLAKQRDISRAEARGFGVTFPNATDYKSV